MNLLERITEAIKEILIGFIKSCLQDLFANMNDRVGTIAGEVGQTPQQWNGGIFSMIQSLSQTVIVPIAGMIITFVLCYELITMITEKNNMHEMETFMIFKWIFKAYVAIYLVTNTFDFTMAVFDLAQNVVANAGGVISGNTSIDAASTMQQIIDSLETMEVGELFLLSAEVLLLSLAVKIMSMLITVILYGRMIEIYLYTSVAPIPFATLTKQLHQGTVRTGVPGILHDGMCGNLFRADSYDECEQQHTYSPVLHSGIHGGPGFHAFQDRIHQ